MEKIEQLVGLVETYKTYFKYKGRNNIFSYLDERAFKKKLKYADKEDLFRLFKQLLGPFSYNSLFISDISSYVYPIYLWRVHKTLYKFDTDMATALIKNCNDKNIFNFPCDVLIALPFNGMYIECNICDRYYGFFAYTRKNEDGNFNLELLMDYCDPQLFNDQSELDIIPFDLIIIELIHSKTIEEQLETIYRATNDIANSSDQINTTALRPKYDRDVCRAAISLLLYILSAEADIKQNKKNIVIYADNLKILPPVERKVNTNEVGYRIGESIRVSLKKKNEEELRRYGDGVVFVDTVRQRNSYRPHIRKGHWHHHWTGPRNDPDKQQLIIKWHAPTSVNGCVEFNLATTHSVEKVEREHDNNIRTEEAL